MRAYPFAVLGGLIWGIVSGIAGTPPVPLAWNPGWLPSAVFLPVWPCYGLGRFPFFREIMG